jgi:hypothetical protein
VLDLVGCLCTAPAAQSPPRPPASGNPPSSWSPAPIHPSSQTPTLWLRSISPQSTGLELSFEAQPLPAGQDPRGCQKPRSKPGKYSWGCLLSVLAALMFKAPFKKCKPARLPWLCSRKQTWQGQEALRALELLTVCRGLRLFLLAGSCCLGPQHLYSKPVGDTAP